MSRLACLTLCVAVFGSLSSGAEEPLRHALLVGCTHYQNLEPHFQLRGPVNDVQLMRQLLIDRFDFDAERDDIVVLAASEDVDHKPTRANIQREFTRLAKDVQRDEIVVILLGGHGSQQPDNDPDNPDDVEPDGLDEIYLPSDVGVWNGGIGSVENAIIDDEFRSWLVPMVSRQAFVWLIMDACHSGSGIRGSDAEIVRHVPPDRLIPDEALATARQPALGQSVGTRADSLFDGPGGLVAIYAAQPHEVTPEKRFPLDRRSKNRKYYGLLTYTVSEVLSGTTRGLTYNELVQAVQTRYITMGRRSPTPLIEGSHRDKLVLGRESFPIRSRILLQREEDRPGDSLARQDVTINAGAIHGLTSGSILAVYPPAGAENSDADAVIGHVLVTRVDMTYSVVEPCEFSDIPAPKTSDLPHRARCQVVYRDVGEHRLQVAVDPKDADGRQLAPATLERLVADLRSQASNLVTVVDKTSKADWLIRFAADDQQVQLVPAEGVSSKDQAGHREAIAPVSVKADWFEAVIQKFEHIARARGLLRLAGIAQEKADNSGIGLSLTVSDGENRSIEWKSHGRTLRDGQRVVVKLKNSGRFPIDVTLLYVDSAYGITCLYPNIGEFNRLEAHEQQDIRLAINATTTGIENLVAIAVRGERQPVDFCLLAQPALKLSQLRGRGKTLESALGQLCRTAMYGSGNTRGVKREDAENYQMKVLTWRVEP